MSDIDPRIRDVLSVIYDDESRRWTRNADYRRDCGINLQSIAGFCGAPTVTEIILLPNRRFDLPDGHGGEIVEACVIETLSADGETRVDLVAWPTGNPADVRTLLGRAPIVGMWQAMNPCTYTFEHPLIMHRTPLDWLKSGCDGAAVVEPNLAALTFLEINRIGGRIGAQDTAHKRELKGYFNGLIDAVEIVTPKPNRRRAA